MEIVNFLRDNWQWLSALLVGLLDLLFILFKKPYKVYGYYLDLVNWVKEAEDFYGAGHGKEKFERVFSKYIAKYGKDATNYEFEKVVVANAVDKILSTPQKKGVK